MFSKTKIKQYYNVHIFLHLLVRKVLHYEFIKKRKQKKVTCKHSFTALCLCTNLIVSNSSATIMTLKQKKIETRSLSTNFEGLCFAKFDCKKIFRKGST